MFFDLLFPVKYILLFITVINSLENKLLRTLTHWLRGDLVRFGWSSSIGEAGVFSKLNNPFLFLLKIKVWLSSFNLFFLPVGTMFEKLLLNWPYTDFVKYFIQTRRHSTNETSFFLSHISSFNSWFNIYLLFIDLSFLLCKRFHYKDWSSSCDLNFHPGWKSWPYLQLRTLQWGDYAPKQT